MNKYENGKIYKLVCNITNKIYYGSTIQPLHKRLYEHKSHYKKYLIDNKKYITSFEILKEGNFDIILVELVNCSCKIELRKKERYYIDNNECVNKCIPTRTIKEYQNDNKDNISIYKKEYRETHKDIINEKDKNYRETHKEDIKKYRETHKEEQKKYRKKYYQLTKK